LEESEQLDNTTAVAFSPDKSLIASGGSGVLRLWSREDGKPLLRLSSDDPIEAIAFSPDSRTIATGGRHGVVRIRDARTGKIVREWVGHPGSIKAISYYKEGRFVISAGDDGTRFWMADSGRLAATLVSFADGGWAVVNPEGRFDTDSLDDDVPLRWVVSDEPFRPLPIQSFMRQYYTPKLLPKLLAGEGLPSLPAIAEINRVLPRIGSLEVDPIAKQPDRVRVRVQVAQESEGGRASGIRDLRLFRDGQLVDLKQGLLVNGSYVFDNVWLPDKSSVEFSAYALNSALVKSDTVRARYELREKQNPSGARTFMLNIGVNKTLAGCENLAYAASDALERVKKVRKQDAGHLFWDAV
jgi:WD40 repeat protein